MINQCFRLQDMCLLSKMVLPIFLSLLLLCISSIFAQKPDPVLEDENQVRCHTLSVDNYTCSHCIQLDPKCAWCADEAYDDNNARSRCDTLDRLRKNGCQKVESPQSWLTITKDYPLSDTKTVTEGAIQIRPQEIDIGLRPGEPKQFEVKFRQAVDYPVDLYYLMDLSKSMKDDKDKLVTLGDALSERMRQITKNFRLGFGSFVDKKVMPFVDARPDKANKPCVSCVPPYGFKNHLQLTNNTQQFATKVNEADISGNLDAPEGGFDAIMQSLTCQKEIGWRERSRRMIVFSTDAGFHFAGDGRLAGIVVPNDGQCHMSREGYYTMSTEQDYPSVAQLHYELRDKRANLIFAVTADQVNLYKHLQKALPEVTTSVGTLKADSRNIVELIAKEYEKISEKIIMVDNGTTEMKISYSTACKGTRVNATNECGGIKVGDTITYNVSIEVTKCTETRDYLLHIGPSDLQDHLVLLVKVLCDCKCEESRQFRHPTCHGKGDLVCGVCDCTATGATGRFCECDGKGLTRSDLEDQCRKGNDTRAPLCEGRGRCECGQCICFKRDKPDEIISGRYCECDNFNCPRHNRSICNGEHGECVCGKCKCKDGYDGRACECPTSEAACMAPNGKLCNGKGLCQCGVCKCFREEGDVRYSGPQCTVCPTCANKCQRHENCVECKQWGTGPLRNEDDCNKECKYEVIPVDELPSANLTEHCQAVDEKDCTFYFAYWEDLDQRNVTIWVKKEKRCPPPVPVLAIVLGVIAGIVIIGLLLLLLWKILTILHDRREYAKFLKDSSLAKWDTGENPIFNPATSTFKNPAYGGKL